MLKYNFNNKKTSKQKVSAKFCRYFLCFSFILTLLLSFPEKSFADYEIDNNYTTDSFLVNININENYSFDFEETIDVNFINSRHGIFRYIPIDKSKYSMSNVNILNHMYETSYEKDFTFPITEIFVAKIGDPAAYVIGPQRYQIKYQLVGRVGKNNEGNMIILDLLPSKWPTNINYSKININSFTPLDWDKAEIFTGSYGSKIPIKDVSNLHFRKINDTSAEIEGLNLSANKGITIQIPIDSSLWVNPYNFGMYSYIILFSFAIMTLLFLFIILRNGREKLPAPTVEFYPPNNLPPADIGYVIDSTIDGGDLSSMLIYFANKGYLKVTPINNSSDKSTEPEDFEFRKIKDIDPSEPTYAIVLFNRLFDEYDYFITSEESTDFAEAVSTSKPYLEATYRDKLVSRSRRTFSLFLCLISTLIFGLTLYNSLIAGGVTEIWLGVISLLTFFSGPIRFKRNRLKKEVLSKAKYKFGIIYSLTFMTISNILAFFLFKEAYSNYILISIATVLFSFSGLFAQTALVLSDSKELLGLKARIIGFRHFIETCEKDRLKALLNTNPEYFFHILPYAYVLGLSAQWIKTFEKLEIPPVQPSWYGGGFYYNYFLFRSLTASTSRAYATSLANKISAETGGSSGGGGFSGGGFGGGGGGSW